METLRFDHLIRKRNPIAANRRDAGRLAVLIAVGVGLRLILMSHPGYTYDIDYFFRPWANELLKTPLGKIYSSGALDVDYPPLYLYVIFALSKIASIFHVPLDHTAASTRFLFKYPGLLADVGLAVLVWHLARKHYRSTASLWAAGFVFFNPALFYNSAVWGQVDTILVLFVVGILYLTATNRTLSAAFLFGLGVTFKPQVLFLLPVVGTTLLLNGKYWRVVLAPVAAAASVTLVTAPFAGSLNPVTCMTWLADKFQSMEDKYKYLSMNMWNVWHSVGKIVPEGTLDTSPIVRLGEGGMHVPSFHAVGLGLIAVLAVVTALLLVRRRDEGTVFLAGAVMILGVTLLGTRMHERYPLPAVMLMAFVGLYYAALRPFYYLLTLLHLTNVHAVLSSFLASLPAAERYSFMPNEFLMKLANAPVVVSFCTIFFYSTFFLMLAYLFYATVSSDALEKEKRLGWAPEGFLGSLLADLKGGAEAVRAFLSRPLFERRPALRAPFVWYPTELAYDRKGRDWFEKASDLFMSVVTSKKKPEKEEEEEDEEPGFLKGLVLLVSSRLPDPGVVNRIPPFRWFARAFDPRIPLNRFTRADAGLLLFLLATAGAIFFYNYWNPPYLYFDEEYFAKTAYQFARLEHLYPTVGFPWETTHPHLGKLIQAAFIKVLGFEPWAYRIPNLLMGVFSVGFLYLLARDVLRSRRTGFFAAFFFMLCGLSFSQARLCTIDSPSVFFMMVAFFCFYKYFAGLWPKLPALAATSVAVGFAIATKWTSVFAMGMLMFLMFWRETAALFAPVYSNSPAWKRMLCRWFSSRPFELRAGEEELLDPAPEEPPTPEPLPSEPSGGAPAQTPERPPEPLPASGEAFVQPKGSLKGWLSGLGMFVLFLVVIPLFIYAVSFVRLIQTSENESRVTLRRNVYEKNLPGRVVWWYYSRGLPPGSEEVTVPTDSLTGVFALAIERSREMYDYHSHVGKEENYKPHPYESRWYHWPLLLKVIWYDSWSTAFVEYPERQVEGVVAIGNPLLFWFGLPCMLFLVWGALEERRIGLLFVAAGFSFMYLPWVISPRQVTFLYHYLPAQPFLMMAIAYTMEDFWRERFTRWLSMAFILGVILVFFYFYPWLNDLPLSETAFKMRLWSGSWGVGY